ncbi:MAG: tRNA (N(6)-L-threonylcarbamoyladenosine(37)-C(2))-methylthiotransferase MtaB, partial [Candidatus Omnitrophica bacterium]|nr:tRNA (N(6)-L-threonylcarbamoyladenosine(37)-C(2))-methylthiotransferase MtaB [Candidatus Omnitrophota bacterium]
MKTIKFYTLGCKVNQYETQVIREQFLKVGFKEINNKERADIYVINTCTVTESADAKSRRYIHMAYKENPKARIVVCGCYTELDSQVIKRIKGVTHIVKNKDKYRIPQLLNVLKLKKDTQEEFNNPGISDFSGHTRAFLKIQDGCNNFCSFCKVPLVRGRSRSKPLEGIVKEARQLARKGYKEIVLCGICLGDYGKDLNPPRNLVEVIEELEKIDQLLRIRLSSIEAKDITDELINKFAECKKLCPHLHIPFQSGDDEVLKFMHRRYSFLDYLSLIQKIKMGIPEVSITTDIMVGFPGETEERFQNTLDLIKRTLPLKVHIFPYSRRQGTVANNLKSQVPIPVIKERVLRLKKIAEECRKIYIAKFLKKEMEVLFEDQKEGFWEGFTKNYIKVKLNSKANLRNKLIKVVLKKINPEAVLAINNGTLTVGLPN